MAAGPGTQRGPIPAHMVATAEIRWFLPGAPPDEAWAWIDRPPAPARIDRYLVFPNCDAVGVKLREGALEIKARCGVPRPVEVAGIPGFLDEWVKRSIPESDAHGGDWLDVTKCRAQFWIVPDGNAWHRIDEEPSVGCEVELTAVECRGASWTTFGFEMFGETDRPRQLIRAATFFLVHSPPPDALTLSSKNSLSYPAWLMAN